MALLHINFYSQSLRRNASSYVILPQVSTKQIGLESVENETIPVLWLLHGASDDHTTWMRRTSIERYVSPLGWAVVMPDVEKSSYANQAHGNNYYDYVTKELPSVLRSYLNISTKREDNYICGLSMGGDGALKIGLSNPDKYSVIGCMSAGFFHPEISTSLDTSSEEELRKYNLFTRLDSKDLTVDNEECALENARKIIEDGKNIPRVFHSIGDGDHCLGHAKNTREFFESFEGNPFDYTYEQYPGRHNWDYWDTHIQRFIKFVRKEL